MNNLFAGLEHVQCYIEDILCITKGDWDNHLTRLNEVLQRLKNSGMKVNASKTFFGTEQLDYLGYIIS